MKVVILKCLGFSPAQVDEDTEEVIRPNLWDYNVAAENGKIDNVRGDQFYRNGSVFDMPNEFWA